MFISNAYAAGPGSAELMSFLPLVIIFVLFYFMIIRPQMKQQKEQKAMIEALKVGDEVVTTGGIVGKINKVTDDFVKMEINANSEMTIQKQAIQSALPKGTIKGLS